MIYFIKNPLITAAYNDNIEIIKLLISCQNHKISILSFFLMEL